MTYDFDKWLRQIMENDNIVPFPKKSEGVEIPIMSDDDVNLKMVKAIHLLTSIVEQHNAAIQFIADWIRKHERNEK